MNINDLLKAEKEVPFTLDGKNHSVRMVSPTAATAKQLRAEFYALGNQVERANKKGGDATLGSKFEEVIAKCVSACFPADSDEAQLDEDMVRLFVLRIGGDKSEVVRYAMEVCGIPVAEQAEKADDSDPSPF